MANHDDYCEDCGHNLMALDCSENKCSTCCDSSSCPRHGDDSASSEGQKCNSCDEIKEEIHDSCGYCTDYCCDCPKCDYCEGYLEDLPTFTCSKFGCSAAMNEEPQCYECHNGNCKSCGNGEDVEDWDDGSGSWESTMGLY